ncbi:Zinc finger and SCAN domain-containing protein 5B [Cichlidogyrus casuarinus]|uniref:Zinc finger and SCAN domain-containing protein 5B n=1 Tax=Cichlidogyrus casuarinus TaxID=1844966 RepID=A0ABD2Q8P5_9PLAT
MLKKVEDFIYRNALPNQIELSLPTEYIVVARTNERCYRALFIRRLSFSAHLRKKASIVNMDMDFIVQNSVAENDSVHSSPSHDFCHSSSLLLSSTDSFLLTSASTSSRSNKSSDGETHKECSEPPPVDLRKKKSNNFTVEQLLNVSPPPEQEPQQQKIQLLPSNLLANILLNLSSANNRLHFAQLFRDCLFQQQHLAGTKRSYSCAESVTEKEHSEDEEERENEDNEDEDEVSTTNAANKSNHSTCSLDGNKDPAIFFNPEPENAKELIREMLKNNNPLLKFVNDGMAIKNPFAVDRKTQLSILTNMLCVKLQDGSFKCTGCGRTTDKLRPMQQHLLSHSGCKFNLCIKCLKGFNDKYDMKRHTRKHTFVKPFQCPECSRAFSQRCSLEGHRRKIHQVVFNYTPNQRREVVRVCERCGYSCPDVEQLVEHLNTQHPGDPCIERVEKQAKRMRDRKFKHSALQQEQLPDNASWQPTTQNWMQFQEIWKKISENKNEQL